MKTIGDVICIFIIETSPTEYKVTVVGKGTEPIQLDHGPVDSVRPLRTMLKQLADQVDDHIHGGQDGSSANH